MSAGKRLSSARKILLFVIDNVMFLPRKNKLFGPENKDIEFSLETMKSRLGKFDFGYLSSGKMLLFHAFISSFKHSTHKNHTRKWQVSNHGKSKVRPRIYLGKLCNIPWLENVYFRGPKNSKSLPWNLKIFSVMSRGSKVIKKTPTGQDTRRVKEI